MKQRTGLWAVLVGGSVAGSLDILFAITFAGYYGAPPTRVLQTVASGVLGSAAFSTGLPGAALGLALHFAIAYLLAVLFLQVARRFSWLVRHAVVSGIAFGIGVFLGMRLVVLPLSAFPRPVTFKPLATTLDLLSHTLLFGIPIALAVRQTLKKRGRG